MARLREFLGIECIGASVSEKIFSGISGFLGVLLCFCVSSFFVNPVEAPILIASMGASAVLLFGIPHGPLSQPWPLIAGHFISALIGVAAQKMFGVNWWSASAAVGFSILTMHFLRCVHPPGGATALVAVVGGPTIQALGFSYLWKPVLVNVLILLCMAIALNSLLAWRRYPAAFSKVKGRKHQARPMEGIDKTDLEFALKNFRSLLDVSEKDLEDIYILAQAHAAARKEGAQKLQIPPLPQLSKRAGRKELPIILDVS